MADCPYCELPEPDGGGWVHSDEHWLVVHGPADTTMAGALRGTDFLNAPQRADRAEAERAADAVRAHLAGHLTTAAG